MRLVCVGDSFTEGVADELRPDGEYRGWSDRVAAAMAGVEPVEYANLAVRGKPWTRSSRSKYRTPWRCGPTS